MPTGRYTVMDGPGTAVGTEEFRCAPGPAGWRYFSTIETSVPEPHRETVDFVVDSGWRPVRLRIDTTGHDIELTATADRLVGARDGEPLEIAWSERTEIDYLSPCFNAVTANRLRSTSEIDVVYLDPVTCEPGRVRQRYERLGEETVETPIGRFDATRWQYTSLDTGWSAPLWVAGDVVVAFEGLFELAEYEPGQRGPIPR